jgi:hypothetical protein
MVEQDKERVFAMTDRRRDMLEELASELNPKAYEAYT